MHAMQYEITLPADYDMRVVRDRVAGRGHLLDGWEGLGLKAYLIRERGVDGSPVNQYAPFYLWNTVAGMNSFLWGGGFQGIVDDFGRPSVRQWTGVAHEEGGGTSARTAVRGRRRVPGGVRPAEVVEEAVRETARLASLDGAVLAAAAVDTSRWEIVHFSVWDHDEPKAEGEVFQVLYMNKPERELLPRGRHW
ncbi:uncharacterized protein SGFS_014530 [Streptomyces graminofaciens]|uniref:DUF4865 domain-containing protein n=1 Tax=Streptomyces graminofaciens TaxID=68212 RepID=A0ABM7F304_9ACTN|nr:DUF4865 family protein [Streptomyces graminofaciens]BBC30159.1 uncharacterized protein SGFS_014530 [Streptomyces graminofaciens]